MSQDEKPRLDPELVEEFVRISHADFDRVKEMLEAEPGLLNASWDWGAGDFETGLGAAAHMGRTEIAEYLLSKGAPMDIFAAVVTGRIELVRAFIADNPDVVHAKGAHGIPLIVHAKQGGQAEVVELLKSHEVE
ncbi:MAG: ankyrin repeat domain-containing protein [bacterium]|nr:ankyrin repeat domain-containing protein [bacterium]